jgi:3D (Asp-Asp-Asp) domain-containing protein
MISALVAAAILTGSGSAYSTCDGSTTLTASGRTVQVGYVAANGLRLGTWIEMRSPRFVLNRRWFKVMDRGGMASGTDLDFWTDDCDWMNVWGRRRVSYRVVPRSELYRGKPYKGWKVRRGARGAQLVWSPR